jgi:ceramide glucosyltransferase
VTVLKPVKGIDDQAVENFESFCRQDYPAFQILFGVSEPDDPAVPLIRSLIAAHPELEIDLIVASESLGANRKISTLCQMLPHAKHPFLIFSDSDTRVGPDYLKKVMASFADPKVGLVTTLYQVRGAETPGAALEALTVNTDFIPSVLVAERLEGLTFAMGATIAVRRETLEAIKGLESLADYLADDYQLGNRVYRSDRDLVLSETVIDHVVRNWTFREYLLHQLRWNRTYRVCRPSGYFFSLLTHGMFFTTALVLLNPFSPLAYQLFIGYAVLRLGIASWIQGRYLGEADQKYLWLLPVRDLLAVGIWAASFLGRTVVWRGRRYYVGRDGKVVEREKTGVDGPGPILDGLVDRYFNRRLSPPLTGLFVRFNVHPNSVTVLSIVIGMASCLFFLRGGYLNGVIGALLLQFSALIDCCDGEVARRTGKASEFGRWLDLLGDNLVHFLLFLSLSASSPALGVIAAVGIPLSVGAFILAIRTGGAARAAAYRLGNRDFSLLLLVLALLGRVHLFLLFAAAGVHLFWMTLAGLTVYEANR